MSENMRKIDKNKQKTRQKGKYLTTKIANEEFLCQTQTKIRLIEVPQDFIIAMHSGETEKNQNNVHEFLTIAENHNIRVRVRHAIYGMDDETIKIVERMAQNGLIILELNPDTNLALNNIDDLKLIRKMLKICVEKQIPFVLPSDGAALYQTDTKQIALSGLFAGLDAEGFAFMQKTELAHIARQKEIFDRKSMACPPGYLAAISISSPTYTPEVKAAYEAQIEQDKVRLQAILAENKVITDIDVINTTIAGKKPVVVIGPNGSRWDEIAEHHQIIQECLSALTTLDPNKFFFVSGRTKDHGVGIQLGHILKPTEHLYLGQLLQAEKLVNEIGVAPFTYLITPEGDLLDVAFQIADFARRYNGAVIAIGGGSFTREMITCADNYGVPVLLMAGPPGASTDKASVMPQVTAFRNANELLQAIISRTKHNFSTGTPLISQRVSSLQGCREKKDVHRGT